MSALEKKKSLPCYCFFLRYLLFICVFFSYLICLSFHRSHLILLFFAYLYLFYPVCLISLRLEFNGN